MRLDINGTTLEVADVGDGEPVLLLHGWPDAAKSGATRSPRSARPATVSSRPTSAASVSPTSPAPSRATE